FTNAKIKLATPPPGAFGTGLAAAGVEAMFHTGFMAGAASLWDDMLAATQAALAAKPRPVWCTGHSLGGALAILAALALARRDLAPVAIQQISPFGQPMVGALAAATGLSSEFRNRYYRFVNEDDLVPLLPRSSFFTNDYRHAGTPEVLRDPSSSSTPV